ncbi:Amino acid transporter AVT1A [Eumeta japonica]|uniref:Amino acid transporter AVT1A n=1 Tax=Eumeta variegata TaxID=151549 RepID=A0A4C2AAF1_EUMVA|nr:Amino acid transporter AVT1A [Eumeta japonica]
MVCTEFCSATLADLSITHVRSTGYNISSKACRCTITAGACFLHPPTAYCFSAASAACILAALVGAGAVYLLLAAQLLHATFSNLATVTYCLWILIVTLAMSLYEIFGPPKNFQFIGVMAFLSTLAATVLYFIQMLVTTAPSLVFRYGSHGLSEFFLAFGVILFAFAGGSTFPALQNAMADRTQFYKSINYSFAALLCLYLTIAVTGYQVYGESASPNIANRMASTPLTLAGNVFMIVNLLSAFVIIIDPVCHEMEDLYKVTRGGYMYLVFLS